MMGREREGGRNGSGSFKHSSESDEHELLAPELLGKLIAELPHMRAQLIEQNVQLEKLIEERSQRNAILSAGRWLAGILIGALLTASGWFYTQWREHDLTIARHSDAIVAVQDTNERQQRNATATQESLSGMRSELAEQRATLSGMARNLDTIQEDLRELRRPRR